MLHGWRTLGMLAGEDGRGRGSKETLLAAVTLLCNPSFMGTPRNSIGLQS